MNNLLILSKAGITVALTVAGWKGHKKGYK